MNGSKITAIARGEIGQTENPPNSNKTKYGIWYGMDGVSWCAIFVSWCFDQAGKPLGKIDSDKGYHYCPSAYNHFVRAKEITTNPKEGDIVLFSWKNDHVYNHTGIFIKWVDELKGTFESVEGNTSVGDDSNGGKVMVRNRNKSVAVFIHPRVLNEK